MVGILPFDPNTAPSVLGSAETYYISNANNFLGLIAYWSLES